MALVKQELGKDTVILATKEEYAKPISEDSGVLSIRLDDDDAPVGPVKANGDINWACPCMGSMVSGPCGYVFREAFQCFHVSKEEPKGVDCFDKFRDMSACMSQYPTLFGSGSRDDGEEDLFSPDQSQNSETTSTETLGMQHKHQPSEQIQKTTEDSASE